MSDIIQPMREVFVTGETLPDAYHKALLELNNYGDITPCPDWNTMQKECSMTMIVENPIQEPMISKCFIGGFYELEQYRQEMLDGILDFEVERGNWAYTYHQRYAKQYDMMKQELIKNSHTRRAIMNIRSDDDIGSNEPACMQSIQYFIRDGKLYCKVLFRSNDACKATFMNAFALILMQKRLADELCVQMGTYVHRANSFHCYERDFGLLNGYCKRIFKNEKLTYNYVGEWDELMEDAKPMIAKAVSDLKNK